MNISKDSVKSLLAQVGLRERAVGSELAPGIAADTYESDYARLYITNCLSSDSVDWPDLVRQVDRRVLQDVRATELSGGGVIDAHVCFVVVDDKTPLCWAQQNEQIVRNVSRKYWIKGSRLQEDLQNRLTILPIADAAPLHNDGHIDLSREDRDWLDALVVEGVPETFNRFVSALGTSK